MPRGRKGKKKSKIPEDDSSEKDETSPERNDEVKLKMAPVGTEAKAAKATVKRGAKVKSSPRKLGKSRNKRKAAAVFEEDDNLVEMQTAEFDEGSTSAERPPNGDGQPDCNERNGEASQDVVSLGEGSIDGEDNFNDEVVEETDEGEIEESTTVSEGDTSDTESEDEVVKVKRPSKRVKKRKSISVEDLERELLNVNRKMARMQQLIDKEERDRRKRSRSRRRSQSRRSTRSRSNTPRRKDARKPSRGRRSRSESRSPSRRYRDRSYDRGNNAVTAHNVVVTSPSESTIYRSAVRPNRLSSSSEEAAGDVYAHIERTPRYKVPPLQVSHDCYMFTGQRDDIRDRNEPSTSRQAEGRRPRGPGGYATNHVESPEERAEAMIRQAEASKARMLDVAGMTHLDQLNDLSKPNLQNEFVHSAMVDESFLLVAAHVDDNLKRKIELGQYVDFSKLLPSDRIATENDNRMVWVQEGGNTFLAPANQKGKEIQGITSFHRWEQSFRVFSDIYTRAHPDRASELIQYNHVIGTAAATYTWENVYMYDCQFRIHMGKNPTRSWSIILQQAWAMYLKDKHRLSDSHRGSDRKLKREICWRFNGGKCTYGNNCKFDHRCGICNRFGHGAHNCRKAHDRNDRRSSNYYGNNNNNDRGGDKPKQPSNPSPARHNQGSSQAAAK